MRFVRILLILAVLVLAVCAAWLVYLIPWVCLFAAVFVALLNAKRGYAALTSHGSARWADEPDLKRAGMLDADSGLILGRITPTPPSVFKATRQLFDRQVKASVACEQFVMSLRLFAKRQPLDALVRLPKAVHTAVFAPTGVGKGVSLILPFLLRCGESLVVLDFKGENALLTAEHRRKLGHRTVLLDPYQVATKKPDSFNPLDMIDKDSPNALDDCRDMADALVVVSPNEKDPHWPESAKKFIAAMIAAVVYHGTPEDRSLQTVKTLLSNPKKTQAAIALLCASELAGGLLARMGQELTHYVDKELASTMTSALRHLSFLDTPAIVESTKRSTFDLGELPKGKVTIYLILPPDKMRAQSALLRMWVGAMLRACVRNGLQEENKVHLVLDESASLGHLSVLDDAVDKYRGYGVRLQFYYQSLGQLKTCWPNDGGQTLLSNTTQVFFGVNDHETAQHVSDRLGEHTIVVDSGGTNDGDSHTYQDGGSSSGTSRGRSSNWALQGRKLLKPEEVTALPARTAITFTPGLPPLATTLTRYYEEAKRLPGRFRQFLLNLELATAAVCLLALAIGLGWGLSRITSNPKGTPNVSAVPQGNRR